MKHAIRAKHGFVMNREEYRDAVKELGGLSRVAKLLCSGRTTIHYRMTGQSLVTREATIAILWLLDNPLPEVPIKYETQHLFKNKSLARR